jgi:hypothetical protein
VEHAKSGPSYPIPMTGTQAQSAQPLLPPDQLGAQPSPPGAQAPAPQNPPQNPLQNGGILRPILPVIKRGGWRWSTPPFRVCRSLPKQQPTHPLAQFRHPNACAARLRRAAGAGYTSWPELSCKKRNYERTNRRKGRPKSPGNGARSEPQMGGRIRGQTRAVQQGQIRCLWRCLFDLFSGINPRPDAAGNRVRIGAPIRGQIRGQSQRFQRARSEAFANAFS